MSTRISIRVEASDTTPGAIVLLLVFGDNDERALPPLAGEELTLFTHQLLRAMAQAKEHEQPDAVARAQALIAELERRKQLTKGT